jgi:predicted transposase/invertase (TIGR01784 family)
MKANNQNPAQNKWGTHSLTGIGPFPFGDGVQVLDIRYDPVFKAVFTKDTAKSRGALSDLISALIGRVVVVDVITANEPALDNIRQRYLRFDVNCRADKGELINVEMSFHPRASEPLRLEYHTARLFTSQDIHGKDKSFHNLKETYQIAILANGKFFTDNNFSHSFLYYDPENRVSLGGKTKIITVELEKTKPIADKPVKNMTDAELWAVFINYLTDPGKRDKIIEIINHEEGIAMAVATLGTFTQNEIEYMRQTAEIMAELDYNTAIADATEKAKEQGLQRGLEQGQTKASLDIARKMKAMGLPISQIAEGTGLSTETVNQL